MEETPDRHIYRLTRFHDIVPTVPPVYYVPGTDGYKHVGEGWKLSPDEENCLVPRKNEVGTTIENDPKPNSMEFHCEMFYADLVESLLNHLYRALDVLRGHREGLEDKELIVSIIKTQKCTCILY
jgi:hypothetical protein